MIDHVTLRVSDRAASQRFYETVLEPLGIEPTARGDEFLEWHDFSIAEGAPVTRGLHVGFVARSRAHVDRFHAAGVRAGYADDGAPGERPQYTPDYYGAFLLDPDGNSIEAVHHAGMHEHGIVDHLWIRVGDLAAAARFYDTIAPHAGLQRFGERPERVHFRTRGGASFALVQDGRPRTEHVHLAFAAPEGRASVDAFHAAATAAGYADNGAPGERPRYHPGYYGAFVLDPEGHNVEVVFHDRNSV